MTTRTWTLKPIDSKVLVCNENDYPIALLDIEDFDDSDDVTIYNLLDKGNELVVYVTFEVI